jgi:hypothetical protein
MIADVMTGPLLGRKPGDRFTKHDDVIRCGCWTRCMIPARTSSQSAIANHG